MTRLAPDAKRLWDGATKRDFNIGIRGGTKPHAFAELRTTLEGLGFSLAVEHFDHQAFGSVYVEYRRGGKWIRIIWDGKESALLARVSPAQENVWTDVEDIPGGPPKDLDLDLDDERIERLRDAIERIAEGAG